MQSGSDGALPIAVLYDVLEQVSRARQLVELLIKAGRDLALLGPAAQPIEADDPEAAHAGALATPEVPGSRADITLGP